MEVLSLRMDKLKVLLREDHLLVKYDTIFAEMLCEYPFLLLEKGNKKVVSEVFQKEKVKAGSGLFFIARQYVHEQDRLQSANATTCKVENVKATREVTTISW